MKKIVVALVVTVAVMSVTTTISFSSVDSQKQIGSFQPPYPVGVAKELAEFQPQYPTVKTNA